MFLTSLGENYFFNNLLVPKLHGLNAAHRSTKVTRDQLAVSPSAMSLSNGGS